MWHSICLARWMALRQQKSIISFSLYHLKKTDKLGQNSVGIFQLVITNLVITNTCGTHIIDVCLSVRIFS